MTLLNLGLKNFRSYSELFLEFSSRLIFFIGINGIGKTNILESISILSQLKSFRGNTDDEMIRWGTTFFYIKCQWEENQEIQSLEYGYEKIPMRRKKIKHNGLVVKKQQDAYGKIPTIILSPMDLMIVEGSHPERRKFIDTLISFLEPNYLPVLNEYNRIIKQRNAYLKNQDIRYDALRVWDHLLAEKDHLLREYRKKWIQDLNLLFQEDLKKISLEKDWFSLEYFPYTLSKEEFIEKIEKAFPKDLKVGYTTVGCHRDEIQIGDKEKDILSFGSQGQKRSVVICLKTASYSLIRKKLGKNPILLIDDIIRELDINRRQFFVELIRSSGQAFFTTTDLDGMQDYIGNLEESRQIFLIDSHQVSLIK